MQQTEVADRLVRQQLVDRRARLVAALPTAPGQSGIHGLLAQVDAALERVEAATFGLCAACHDPIEPERLAADPLIELCLDCLTDGQRRALELDLALAARLQSGLLPPRTLHHSGWDVAFGYRAARVVSGDYCDAIVGQHDRLHVIVGDVSGKGVSAALLMAQLHALFRTLASLAPSMEHMFSQVNDTLCKTALATHYATLVGTSAGSDGEVTVVNAGHPPPLVYQHGHVSEVDSAGLPLGMFSGQDYRATSVTLDPDDFLVLYSDGITEAENDTGQEFGRERLAGVVTQHAELPPSDLVRHVEAAVLAFSGASSHVDDRTVAVFRRASMRSLSRTT